MWWHDLLWGFFNGFTAWVVWIVHVFGGWDSNAVYDVQRQGDWYDFGFLAGAGSPLFGMFNAGKRSSGRSRDNS